VAHFMVLSLHLSGSTDGKLRILSQDSRSLVRILNPIHLENKIGVLTTQSQCCVPNHSILLSLLGEKWM
jgi:hypothetical protein